MWRKGHCFSDTRENDFIDFCDLFFRTFHLLVLRGLKNLCLFIFHLHSAKSLLGRQDVAMALAGDGWSNIGFCGNPLAKTVKTSGTSCNPCLYRIATTASLKPPLSLSTHTHSFIYQSVYSSPYKHMDTFCINELGQILKHHIFNHSFSLQNMNQKKKP